MTKKTEQAKRRIKLRLDFQKSELIEKRTNDFVDFANEKVIPLLRKLEMSVTKENVVKYSEQPQQLKVDFIAREIQSANVGNDYLERMVKKEAEARFNEAFSDTPYEGRNIIYSEFAKIEKGMLCADLEAIQEAATVYVEDPAQLEAYDRHQKAVEALNDFFSGKAPDCMSLYHYFPVVNGVVQAGTMISYVEFIK